MSLAPKKVDVPTESQEKYGFALVIFTGLFFMWGFLTCLNDILLPHLKGVFTLSYTQAALVQMTFFSAYFLMAIPAGKVVARFGYQKGMVVGLLIAALGSFLFVPAAMMLSYSMFLLALFVLATGITVLQVGANPFVTELGPSESAAARLNLTQAFNSLGTTIAPWFGGMLILSTTAMSPEMIEKLAPADRNLALLKEASTVIPPYLGLGAVLVVLAVIMGLCRLPKIADEKQYQNLGAALKEALQHRQLALGALGIFLYVGAEVSIGSFLVSFMGESHIAGLAEHQAAHYVSYYWGGAMVGRFIGAALMRKIDAAKLLAGFSLVAAALVTLGILSSGGLAMWSLIAVGLFNSIMFPSIFALAISGLGNLTSAGSSILVMSIVGGAVVPMIFGIVADGVGLQHAFILPAVCYLYILYYGYQGRRDRATA